MNTKICKVCLTQKTCMRVETRYKSGRSRWVDKNGKQWNGRTCYDCYYQRKTPEPEEELLGLSEPLYFKPSMRPCRKCKKPILTAHYFYHESCAPVPTGYDLTDFSGGLVKSGPFI